VSDQFPADAAESRSAATTASATTASATTAGSSRRLLWIAAAFVLLIDIVAVIVAAPSGFPDPKSTIAQNLELIPPEVVFDFAPGTPQPATPLVIEFHPSITNSIVVSWIVMILILVVLIAASRGMKPVPRRLQNVWEATYEAFSDFAIGLGGEQARRYIPIFAALFLFIMFANWTDLFLFGNKVNVLRTPTSDINITVGLALTSFVVYHFEGVRRLGVRGYLGKFFNLRGFKRGPADGAIDLFVGLIEFLLEFFKPITLAFRLFGNLYGGGIMVGVFTALLLALLPLPFIALEAFVGFVQALIFSVLTLMYTMMAIESHDAEAHAAPAFSSEPEGNIGPPLSSFESPLSAA